MLKDSILGIVRHTLTTLGGVLVAKGYIDAEGVATAVGSVIALAGVVWSIFDKKTKA